MADDGIREVDIVEEMETSYIDYAMSTIVARAIPDVRDGLKPVHRRLLYSMEEISATPNAAYRKAARVVGDTMGKYHPHGDQALYDALVRMAQPFSIRYPLVDGQGNFGSVDGDPAAAMRYTEARLTPIAAAMLDDLDRDTVEFVDNFDGTAEMPEVLPSVVPNLLINGSTGNRGGNGDEHSAAQPARGGAGDRALHREPGGDLAGPDAVRARAGFPNRRNHRGRGGHRAGVYAGSGADQRAGGGERGGSARYDDGAGGFGDSLPGEQGQAGGEDRGAGAGQGDRGRARHPRRVGPARDAGGGGVARRRAAVGGAEPAVQAHGAAVDLQHQQPGAGGRAAGAAAVAPVRRTLCAAPADGGAAADRVRPEEGAGARALAGRLCDRAGGHRQGDQDHPRARTTQRRPATV